MKIFRRLNQELKNLYYTLPALFHPVAQKIENDVPFVCQFAHPDHAELSLKKELTPVEDTLWGNTGATSPERYAEWAFTMCGMASVAMVISYFKGSAELPVVLAEDALEHNVYHKEFDGTLSAMKYQEFATWVQKYDVYADIITKLSIKGIQLALTKGKLVIVSVNPNIRGYNTAPIAQLGGHLVVVTGYNKTDDTITINNPSGFVSLDSQVGHTFKSSEFSKQYAGRGIIISNR